LTPAIHGGKRGRLRYGKPEACATALLKWQ
jgi:hypothetical protein